MKFYNSWKYNTQWDKLKIELRISKLTIFKFEFDISKRTFNINILNFGLRK